ncbi:MAG: SDR family NAD(P)-dependent oxidoreductase [Candidatus Margulisiibacteriota bacterium]
MIKILLFGISGGLGRAITEDFLNRYENVSIYCPTRSPVDLNELKLSENQRVQLLSWNSENEQSYDDISSHLKDANITLDFCISAIGALHSDNITPEKKLGHLNPNQMMWYFHANAIVHALIIKHFSSLMNKKKASIMGLLSARVGSIGDNKLGGWYSYRAAKAALNMIIKTGAIEMKRYNKNLSIIGIHPGTVDTALSKPFQAHVPDHKLFTPKFAADAIFKNILDQVTSENSGYVFAYDGQIIPE